MFEYIESIEKDKVIQNHVIDSSYKYIVKKIDQTDGEYYTLTSSYDGNIIKTVTKPKQQLFKLPAHTNSIYALDYNEIDDIIVSGSHDKSIKLWSGREKCILINKLINNNKNLLIQNGGGQLQLWKIDLVHRNQIKLDKYNIDDVLIFYQVNQGQNLILFQYQCINILNNQGQIINNFNYIPGDVKTFVYCKQLESAKFIQILAQKILNRTISYLFDLRFSSVSSSQDMLEKQPEKQSYHKLF
ncbi:hypothetical protein pb186bvf_010456 [Paramecium bursaria]